jgi:hypothetical protein
MNRQQDIDKHAKIAMAIISGIIIFLFIIAVMGCNNHVAHKDTYVPRDTIIELEDSSRLVIFDCDTIHVPHPYVYEIGEVE